MAKKSKFKSFGRQMRSLGRKMPKNAPKNFLVTPQMARWILYDLLNKKDWPNEIGMLTTA